MQTGCGLIKNEQYVPDAFAFAQETCQLYPLRFATTKCIAALAQFNIAKSYIL